MIHKPTTEKIEMAIKRLKNGKVSEEDNITTVLLRKGRKALMKKLEQIIIIKTWKEKEMLKV